MDRGWWWKFGMIVAVTLGTVWLLIPTYVSLVQMSRRSATTSPCCRSGCPRGRLPPSTA